MACTFQWVFKRETVLAQGHRANSWVGRKETQGKGRKVFNATMSRRFIKLEKSLGGIRQMGGVPEIIFVIDSNMEDLAIQEAKTLGIPVVAILDSNSNPDNIDYPVPGNDDASRAIKLYCRLVADTALYGMQEALVDSGVDFGAEADISNILELNNNKKEVVKEEKKKIVKKKEANTPEAEDKKVTKSKVKKDTTEKEV